MDSCTLRAASSVQLHELCRVTSATFPAWDTMSTFMARDTCRPVNNAVLTIDQLCDKKKVIGKLIKIF